VTHKDAHRRSETEVHQNEYRARIKYVEHAAVNGNKRYHDDLKRHRHRCHHKRKRHFRRFPIRMPHEKVRRHRRKDEQYANAENGNRKAVKKRPRKIHLYDGSFIIVPLQSLFIDEAQRIFYDLHFSLERIDKNQKKREEIQTQKKYGKHVSVCGEMAGDVSFTKKLLDMGLRCFSMSPANIQKVKRAILSATIEEYTEE